MFERMPRAKVARELTKHTRRTVPIKSSNEILKMTKSYLSAEDERREQYSD
jgi:hypothetical protein